MGRKKKRHNKALIFCYYCDRKFESERVLIQHQRAKHFKCPHCHKRISSAQGMMLHVFQVHKETIEKVPAAKEGRDSFDVEIFGMDGVPEEVIQEKRLKVYGELPPAKRPRMMMPGQPQGILLPGAPTSTMPPKMLPAMHMMIPGGMPLLHHPGMPMMPPGGPLPPRMGAPPAPPPAAGFQQPGMQGQTPQAGPRSTGAPPPPTSQQTNGASPAAEAKNPSPTATMTQPPNGMPPMPHPMGMPSHMVGPPIYATNSMPFGGYAQPMPVMHPQQVPLVGGGVPPGAPPGAPPGFQQVPVNGATNGLVAPGLKPSKNKNAMRVYDDELMSMEEKRAMHPKYSGHLRKHINKLEDSIEARIQMLASNG